MHLVKLSLIILLISSSYAKKPLKAHAHDGEVELKIAANEDGKTILVELEASGDTLLGFEKMPKSKFKKIYSVLFFNIHLFNLLRYCYMDKKRNNLSNYTAN